MVTRKPVVLVSGSFSELPTGDQISGFAASTLTAGSGLVGGGTLDGDPVRVDVSLAASASGLIFVGDALGLDGSAQTTADSALASGNAALINADTALASGNAALVSSSTALSSGNAALSSLTSKVSKAGDVVSGTLVVGAQSYGIVSSTVTSGVILLDFSSNNNFDIILQGNSTLAPSISPSGGQSGAIYIRQDGTGSRTLAYSGGWAFSNGSAPTLTTTASGTDLLAYYAATPTNIIANLIVAVSGV